MMTYKCDLTPETVLKRGDILQSKLKLYETYIYIGTRGTIRIVYCQNEHHYYQLTADSRLTVCQEKAPLSVLLTHIRTYELRHECRLKG